MKASLLSTCVSLSLCAIAQSAPIDRAAIQAKAASLAKEASTSRTNRLTRAELERRPQVLRKTGGFLDVPAQGTAILAVDLRKNPGGAVPQFAEVFGRLSKTNVKVVRESAKAGQTTFDFVCARAEAEKPVYTLVIDEDASREGLTVLPESRIVLINAAKYKGGADPLQPEIRLVKQLWRGLGFVSGIGYAPFKNDVFQPVFTLAELDALEYQVMQPMNFQKMYQTFSKFGVKRARHIPYRLAVHEGWAAAPTNEYQKAVWEDVKAQKERGPSKPITIPPPKK